MQNQWRVMSLFSSNYSVPSGAERSWWHLKCVAYVQPAYFVTSLWLLGLQNPHFRQTVNNAAQKNKENTQLLCSGGSEFSGMSGERPQISEWCNREKGGGDIAWRGLKTKGNVPEEDNYRWKLRNALGKEEWMWKSPGDVTKTVRMQCGNVESLCG